MKHTKKMAAGGMPMVDPRMVDPRMVDPRMAPGMAKGGDIKKYAEGGKPSSKKAEDKPVTTRQRIMQAASRLNPGEAGARAIRVGFGDAAMKQIREDQRKELGLPSGKKDASRLTLPGAGMGVARAGLTAGKKAAETTKKARGGGIEHKGKTKGKMVKMAMGGSVSKRADGIAKKGKTNCKMR
jgi:hypothetical protein